MQLSEAGRYSQRYTRRGVSVVDAARGAPDLQPGACVGRFVIINQLGRGGMGVVYKAYDPELDRRIAIKLLSLRARRVATEARAVFGKNPKAFKKELNQINRWLKKHLPKIGSVRFRNPS